MENSLIQTVFNVANHLRQTTKLKTVKLFPHIPKKFRFMKGTFIPTESFGRFKNLRCLKDILLILFAVRMLSQQNPKQHTASYKLPSKPRLWCSRKPVIYNRVFFRPSLKRKIWLQKENLDAEIKNVPFLLFSLCTFHRYP